MDIELICSYCEAKAKFIVGNPNHMACGRHLAEMVKISASMNGGGINVEPIKKDREL